MVEPLMEKSSFSSYRISLKECLDMAIFQDIYGGPT